MPGRDGVAVQEGEKGTLRAACRTGETGEFVEETGDAPRESGEIAPKPKEKEDEKDKKKRATARHVEGISGV